MGEIQVRCLNELPFRAKTFEEGEQLEAEEDFRIDGGSTDGSVQVGDPLAHEREIERSIKLPVEVVGRDELLKGDSDGAVKVAGFAGTEHRGEASYGTTKSTAFSFTIRCVHSSAKLEFYAELACFSEEIDYPIEDGSAHVPLRVLSLLAGLIMPRCMLIQVPIRELTSCLVVTQRRTRILRVRPSDDVFALLRCTKAAAKTIPEGV